jgi:hypothetical protein
VKKLPKESNKKTQLQKTSSSASGSSSSTELKKSKEKIQKNQHKNGRRKTTMKWNNLAATDVFTATKIATDHGGGGGGDVQELENWKNLCGSK